MQKSLDLDKLVLSRGAHDKDIAEFCVMEATAVWLGEEKKDRYVDDVCPRIEAYARALNDRLPDDLRQRLVAFIPRLPNTKTKIKAQDLARRWMLQETATKFASEAMRAIGLVKEAAKLAEVAITDETSSREWAAEAARAAEAAEAAGAARAAWAAWAAGAVEAAGAARAAGAAPLPVWEAAIDLLDRLIKVTEGE